MYFLIAVSAFHFILTAGLQASHERTGGENDLAIKTLNCLEIIDIFLVIAFATVEVHSTN